MLIQEPITDEDKDWMARLPENKYSNSGEFLAAMQEGAA